MATLITAVSILVARPAIALTPDCTSSLPTVIRVGAVDFNGNPDLSSSAVFVLRSSGAFCSSCPITLDFSNCTDVVLGPTSLVGGGFGSVTCPSTFSGVTSTTGDIEVFLTGYGNGNGTVRAMCNCVRVMSGLQDVCSNVEAATTDRDGTNGVGAGDASLLINDFVNFPGACRSDLSGNALVGAQDLSILIGIFVEGHSPKTASPC